MKNVTSVGKETEGRRERKGERRERKIGRLPEKLLITDIDDHDKHFYYYFIPPLFCGGTFMPLSLFLFLFFK